MCFALTVLFGHVLCEMSSIITPRNLFSLPLSMLTICLHLYLLVCLTVSKCHDFCFAHNLFLSHHFVILLNSEVIESKSYCTLSPELKMCVSSANTVTLLIILWMCVSSNAKLRNPFIMLVCSLLYFCQITSEQELRLVRSGQTHLCSRRMFIHFSL